MRKIIILLICFVFLTSFVFAEEDGTYDATVTTSSGSYTVPVEVENGEVTIVHWPNGGNMHVYGATVEDNSATGSNSRGDSIDIELDN